MKFKHLLIILIFTSLLSGSYTCLSANAIKKETTEIKADEKNIPLLIDDSLFMSRRQYKRLFYEATGYFFENHFQQALPLFMELLKVDPDNAHINFYVGACYMNLPEDKSAALPYLQKAVKNVTVWYDYDYRSNQAPVFAYFYLATVYRNNYKMNDALVNNRIFKTYVSQDNEELMSKVDREIKSIETGTGGGMYAGPAEFSKTFNRLLDNLIQYDVYIRNPEPDVSWWVNNLEGIKREMLVNDIIGVAYSGTVPVYDENNKLLTNEQVKTIGNEPVLKRIQTPNPPYNDTIILIENQLNRQLVTKIRFLEEWYYDDQSMQIGKNIVGYTPLIEEYTEDNVFKGYKPLFTMYFDQKYPSIFNRDRNDSVSNVNPYLRIDSLTNDTIRPVDYTLAPDMTTTIKGLTPLTERIRYDVPVKDMKYRLQPWVENIDYPKRENFLGQLFDMVANGIIQTYDIFDDSLSVRKVREVIQLKTDSIYTKSKYPPYRDTLVITTNSSFDYNRVAKFRFMEEWFLDEKKAQIYKKIVGFAPLIEIFDENRSIKGYTTLFWIYFDRKYPIRISQNIYNFKAE